MGTPSKNRVKRALMEKANEFLLTQDSKVLSRKERRVIARKLMKNLLNKFAEVRQSERT